MKKPIYIFLAFLLLLNCNFVQSSQSCQTRQRTCAATESSYDAIGMSMAIWGVGMAVGIGLLTALIKHSTSHSHSH